MKFRFQLTTAIVATLVLSDSAVFAGQPNAPALPRIPRTPQQIDQLIQQEGTTPAPWWNSVKLNYPPTLLIHWEKPKEKEPWTPSKYLGQYIWSVINENPGKWKDGARLLHHVVEINKDNAENLKTSKKALARIYQHLLQDYPRAAYWWRSAGIDEEDDEALGLAECYFRLGNKDMAKNILTKIGDDYTRHGGVIKLWADMGEFKKAIELAEIKAKDDDADIAYLMAGDTCRLAGKTKEAMDYYQKSLAATKNGRDNKQTKARAQASFDAVKLFDALDVKRIPDGTYSSSSYGYAGQVNVSVIVKAGRIENIKMGAHQEKQYYGALTDTPAQIIKKQTVKGIDTYASATITSEAIINASAKALSNAMK